MSFFSVLTIESSILFTHMKKAVSAFPGGP
jgi:hypothetical protein